MFSYDAHDFAAMEKVHAQLTEAFSFAPKPKPKKTKKQQQQEAEEKEEAKDNASGEDGGDAAATGGKLVIVKAVYGGGSAAGGQVVTDVLQKMCKKRGAGKVLKLAAGTDLNGIFGDPEPGAY